MDVEKTNLVMWDILHAYFKLVYSVFEMSIKKEKMDWGMYLLSSDELHNLMSSFLLVNNNINLMGVRSIHFSADNKLVSRSMNAIRNLILRSIHLVTINNQFKQRVSNNEKASITFKNLFQKYGYLVSESLVETATHSLSIHDIYEEDESVADSLVEQMKFLTSICTKDGWFYKLFLEYSETIFRTLIIPLVKISPSEIEKLETDPQEFVSYTLDLCGTQRSQTPKSEAISLFESIVENVDGGLSKSFRVLFGMLSEVVMDKPGQVLEELSKVEKIKRFSPEDLVDIALLLLADISYTVSSREDQIGLLKGFVIGHFDKILDFRTLLLQSRVLIFFSQYAEFLFTSIEESKYLQKLMTHLTKLMLDQSSPQVVEIDK